MKKILSAALATLAICACGAVSAYAANGDIAGTLYTTDILTQVDGRDITSYSLNGETLIPLEDLMDYGFSIGYDDSIRTLFVNNNAEIKSDFNPKVERGTVGGTAGYIYETDIKVYVNGVIINAYSVNGKMLAKVEELGRPYTTYEWYIFYCMSYSYNNDNRLLSLFTHIEQPVKYEEPTYDICSVFLDSSVETDTINTQGNLIGNDNYISYEILVSPSGKTVTMFTLCYKTHLGNECIINRLDDVLDEAYSIGRISRDLKYSEDKSKLFFTTDDGIKYEMNIKTLVTKKL